MIDLGPATEDAVVLAFLQAEIDSARWGSLYRATLANSGLDRSIIDNPDRNAQQANQIRRELLAGLRGYGANQLLFARFPIDVNWRRVALGQADLPTLKYAKCSPWIELSGGTRFVIEGAKHIGSDTPDEDAAANIRAVAEDLKRGKRYPELIGVDGQNGEIILMEGHTRATAYAVTQLPDRIECLVGSSPSMSRWAFY